MCICWLCVLIPKIYILFKISSCFCDESITSPLIFLLLHDHSGQGTGDGKRALYHCNYCNKDITGKIRIKCAMCPDFDLCIECFSVGAEVKPHKSNHPYRVMVGHII